MRGLEDEHGEIWSRTIPALDASGPNEMKWSISDGSSANARNRPRPFNLWKDLVQYYDAVGWLTNEASIEFENTTAR
jgi:hypothetical protein